MHIKALILLIAGHLVTDINTGGVPAYLPFIKDFLNLSYTMTASIVLVFNLTSSVIQPIFGFFSDRRSAKWLLPAGCFIASLGMALLGFAPSYAWVLFFSAFSGLGQASYHPEGFKAVNLLSGQKKASAMSIFLVGGNLGIALGPLMATLFFRHFGIKGSFWFIFPGLIMTAVFLATIPHWNIKEFVSTSPKRELGPPGSIRRGVFPMTLLLLAVMMRSATRLGLLTFIPFYFINLLKQDPIIGGKYLFTFLLAGTAGTLLGGPVADRFGYKKTVLFTLGITLIFLYLFYYTKGAWSLLFFGVAGFVLISSNAITMAMGQSFMPNNLGMASGLVLGLAMGVGGIVTTALGWVADHWGLNVTLNIIFIMPLLAFVIVLFIPYPPKFQTDTSASPSTRSCESTPSMTL